MWTEADIPDQTGHIAVVTGANTGIGFETARALALHGATVILACRDTTKAQEAVARIAAATQDPETTRSTNAREANTSSQEATRTNRLHEPTRTAATRKTTHEPALASRSSHPTQDATNGEAIRSRCHVVRLDLGSLASVREAAAELRERFPRIDLLINNAGVTGLSGTTADGFEAQFGINHLGHFALTGLLLDRITGRIVTVSSIGHRLGQASEWDSPRNAYARSKLANLLFTFALGRRLDGSSAIAVAAHPGGASTEIFRTSPAWFRGPNLAIARLFGRTPAMGALPSLRAATDPDVDDGDYFGPDGLFEIRGYPTKVAAAARARDGAAQERLWALSERLTSVRFG